MSAAILQREAQISELAYALQSGACLIDVREFPEFAAGRVPGAKLIPLSQLTKRRDEITREQTIYVICRSGRRANEAQQKLLAWGFADVRNVTGGFLAWQDAGLPIERDERAPWALERQVRLMAGSLVLLCVLLSVFVAQPFIWLAGFIGAGLTFAALTNTCAMGMLLARMPWNRAHRTEPCALSANVIKEQ